MVFVYKRVHTMNVSGEQYVRTLTHYIRANERRLMARPSTSSLSGHKRTDSGSATFSLQNLWSISAALTGSYLKSSSPTSTTPTSPANPQKSALLTLDPHHLYYLLHNFAELKLDVGAFESSEDITTLEVHDDNDTSDAASIASMGSITSVSSAMSSLSLFSGWQGWSNAAAQQAEQAPIEQEIKYIYRAFGKFSSLRIAMANQRRIEGSESWQSSSILSLVPFKNLSQLEISGFPVKLIDGWDILQETLESLTVQQGQIDDVSELFITAVGSSLDRRQKSKTDGKTDSETDSKADRTVSATDDGKDSRIAMPDHAWAHLKHINLSENSLTFFPSEPIAFISECTHLDLSHNLLIAVPDALAQLVHLQYVNLSNNMIESLVRVYQVLPNVARLELRNNRIENLCGLERMYELEYVDVRENRLFDWAEISRMNELVGIKEIHVDGNPFTKFENNYRVNIFNKFRENGLEVLLDGSGPAFQERRHLTQLPKTSQAQALDPPAVLGRSISFENLRSATRTNPINSGGSPGLRPQKPRKTRIVDLTGEDDSISGSNGTKTRNSEDISTPRKAKKKKSSADSNSGHLSDASSGKKVVHRLDTVAKGIDGHKRREIRRKKSGNLLASPQLGPRPMSPVSIDSDDDSGQPISPLSPTSPTAQGEEFRKKIEELRREGGSSWLRVFNEMELARKSTREPKLKQIVREVMEKRDKASSAST